MSLEQVLRSIQQQEEASSNKAAYLDGPRRPKLK